MRVAREHVTVSTNSDQLVANLKMFATDIVPKLVRPAAQAGAQVFYDEVRTRVAALGSSPEKAAAENGIQVGTGTLLKAIYQAHSADKSVGGRSVYVISWRTGRARKGSGGLAVAPHGHLVEMGHWRYFKVYERGGRWFTRARPDATGHRVIRLKGGEFRMIRVGPQKVARPRGRASIQEKALYFDSLKEAKRVAGKAFLRGSYEAKKSAAPQAMLERMRAEFAKVMSGQL